MSFLQHKGQLNSLLSWVLTGVTIVMVLVIASIFLGKMGSMNETDFGNNSNTTATINAGFSFLGLSSSISNMILVIGFFVLAIVIFIGLFGKVGKGRR